MSDDVFSDDEKADMGFPQRPTITCPRCGMTSGNPHDVEEGYCGNCGDWTAPEGHGVRAFGTWDAPMTDGAEWLDAVPVEMTCMYCRELFQEGDNGAIMPNGFAQHRECGYRAVMGGIGHFVDHTFFCRSELGPDAGLSYRTSALLVWNFVIEKIPCSRESLLLLSGNFPQ